MRTQALLLMISRSAQHQESIAIGLRISGPAYSGLVLKRKWGESSNPEPIFTIPATPPAILLSTSKYFQTNSYLHDSKFAFSLDRWFISSSPNSPDFARPTTMFRVKTPISDCRYNAHRQNLLCQVGHIYPPLWQKNKPVTCPTTVLLWERANGHYLVNFSITLKDWISSPFQPFLSLGIELMSSCYAMNNLSFSWTGHLFYTDLMSASEKSYFQWSKPISIA